MGEPARQARSAASEPAAKRAEPPRVVDESAGAIDQQLGSLLHGPDGTREVPAAEHRTGVTEQIQAAPAVLLDWMSSGTDVGLAAIARPEAPPKPTLLDDLLSLAVSGLIAGAAGSFAVWLSSQLFAKGVSKRREKFFEVTHNWSRPSHVLRGGS